MKKTFRKQFIILAVVTVMMLALFVSASAATANRCPAATGGAHSSEFVEEVVYAPTCTQDGYSILAYCTECQEIVIGAPYEDKVVEKTGHTYEVSYVADGNGCYKRVRTCQNPLCQRFEVDKDGNVLTTEIKNSTDIREGYYLVELKNTKEAPERTDPEHSKYYDAEYYDAGSETTWLATSYLTKTYEIDKTASVSATEAEPDCEIFPGEGGLKLYVKSGKNAPAFKGTTPKRGKDTEFGAYAFSCWNTKEDGTGIKLEDATITENTTFYAVFSGITDRTDVSYYFCNWNGAMLTSGSTTAYGSTVTYGALNPPTREKDQRAWYEFDGWTIGKNGTKIYKDGIDDIKVYFRSEIYAHYIEHKNHYTVNYVNNNGASLLVGGDALVSENVLHGQSLAEDINTLPDGALNVPRDKKFIYTFENQWEIVKVNGREVAKEEIINSHSFNLPKTLYVYDEDGNREGIIPSDGDVITLAPVYKKTPVRYTFKVKVVTDNFDKNDVYENGMTTSAILDKFAIQVTDANGQYVAHGQTDVNGEYYFSAIYSDSLKVTAASINNNKYYGEKTLYFGTVDQIENYERIGITIAPAVTAEWDEGIKGCTCFCHSAFGGIVVQIYNLLYRFFNIRYVCCDDLFIVHGDTLAYTQGK